VDGSTTTVNTGTFFSPRVSTLVRSGSWTSRLSLGTGFFGPSPLTEETEAAGLTRLAIPARLQAEEGRSGSLDVSRTDGPLSYTFTLFGSGRAGRRTGAGRWMRGRHSRDAMSTAAFAWVSEIASGGAPVVLAISPRRPYSE